MAQRLFFIISVVFNKAENEVSLEREKRRKEEDEKPFKDVALGQRMTSEVVQ